MSAHHSDIPPVPNNAPSPAELEEQDRRRAQNLENARQTEEKRKLDDQQRAEERTRLVDQEMRRRYGGVQAPRPAPAKPRDQIIDHQIDELIVREFLETVGTTLDSSPNPYKPSRGSTTEAKLPIRLLGKLGKLQEKEREITSRFTWEVGRLQQASIPTEFNFTGFESGKNELRRNEIKERSEARENWFRELLEAEKTAFDQFCLASAGRVLDPILKSFPLALYGPLARLAFEVGPVVKIYSSEREKLDKRTGNKSVKVSLFRRLSDDEDLAKDRLVQRWFRELTEEQESVFNGDNTLSAKKSKVADEELESKVPPQWLFAPSGDGYDIAGFGEEGHLSSLKGLADIFALIRTPGETVSMLVLDGVKQQLRNDARSVQPVMDDEGLRQVQQKLQELRADFKRAKDENNSVEADVAQRQIDEIETQMKNASGIGGKTRDLNNPFDKLRPKIHDRLKTAYNAMRNAAPPMIKIANHFEGSISSEAGSFVYLPPGEAPAWQFELRPKK